MAKEKGSITVLTTPYGRYEWWWALSIIDYIPKGKRRRTRTYPLPVTDDTEERVVYIAAKKEIERYKENKK